MNNGTRTLARALAGVTMIGSLLLPGVANASKNGRKNTAYILGAVAAQQLLTKHTTTGVIAGAGALYAYNRYQKSRHHYHVYRHRVVRHRRVR